MYNVQLVEDNSQRVVYNFFPLYRTDSCFFSPLQSNHTHIHTQIHTYIQQLHTFFFRRIQFSSQLKKEKKSLMENLISLVMCFENTHTHTLHTPNLPALTSYSRKLIKRGVFMVPRNHISLEKCHFGQSVGTIDCLFVLLLLKSPLSIPAAIFFITVL